MNKDGFNIPDSPYYFNNNDEFGIDESILDDDTNITNTNKNKIIEPINPPIDIKSDIKVEDIIEQVSNTTNKDINNFVNNMTKDAIEDNYKDKIKEAERKYEMYVEHLKQNHKKELYDLKESMKKDFEDQLKAVSDKYKKDLAKKVNSDTYFEYCGELTLTELFKVFDNLGKTEIQKYLNLDGNDKTYTYDDYEKINNDKLYNFKVKKINNTQDSEDDELLGIDPENDYTYFLEINKQVYDEFINYRQEKYKRYDIIEKQKNEISGYLKTEITNIIDGELNSMNRISNLVKENY